MPNISVALLSTNPVPVVLVEHDEPDPKWLKDLANSGAIESAVKDLLGFDYFKFLMGNGCRGVALSRIEDILAAGVDVRPTNAVIWVDHLDKAVEYGSDAGTVVMVFDNAQLRPASIEFPKSTPETELAQFANEYPMRVDDYHGKVLLSHCGPTQDPGYGLLYGRWIESNAFDALRMVLVIVPAGGSRRVIEIVSRVNQ